MAGFGYQNGMLPLCREAVIFGDDSPAISQLLDAGLACVDHGLYGKNHASFQFKAGFWLAVVQYLRVFMKYAAYAMAAKFAHHAVTHAFNIALDGMADVAQIAALPDRAYAAPHCLVAGLTQAPGLNRWLTDIKHAAGITMVAIFDGGDVEIDYIAILSFLSPGTPWHT